MNGSNKFEYSSKLRNTFLTLLGLGVVLTLIGFFTGGGMSRFWTNLLLDTIYFLGISVLAIWFIAAHQLAMSGWYITIKRIPEAVSQFSIIGAVFMLIIVFGVAGNYHNLYHHWDNEFIQEPTVKLEALKEYEEELAHEGEHGEEGMVTFSREWQEFQYNHYGNYEEERSMFEPKINLTPDSLGNVQNPYYDKLIDGKSGYLNSSFWTIRSLLYLIIWVWIAVMLRRFSLKEDLEPTTKWYMKTKTWAAVFLPVWGVTSSMMAWDWVMSLDPHWYSTLFGWYNFVSLWVACVSTILLIIIYLKRKGYLPQVNENHLHDLGKYIFAFSIFWTYLWFSQFMLYWYGNIPEETKWFLLRARSSYAPLFYANLFLNFFFPFLVFMRRDAKRNMKVLTIVATVMIFSHWLDYFVMIMPTTVGEHWGIGFFEIGLFLTFAGLFLFFVFRELAKAPLIPANHPLLKESLDHHI
ncbi:MAG: hypothetical protein ACHQFW_04135 [Chitinophagales bacterium]